MHRELLLVCVGLAGLTLHALDETRTFGGPSGPPWVAQIAIVTLLTGLTAVHRRLGRLRLGLAGLLALLGLFVMSTGWSAHLWPLLQRGPGPADASGMLFFAGGVLLLGGGALILRQTSAGGFALTVPRPRPGELE